MSRAALSRSAALLMSALLTGLITAPAAAQRASVPRDTNAALPGAHRVGLVGAPLERSSLAITGGYGFTEAVLGDDDAHHRLSGRAAAAAWPTGWLAFGLAFDGRYDKHTGSEVDSGMLGQPSLRGRVGMPDAEGLALGAQVGVTLPGEEWSALGFDALVVDFELLASLYLGAVSVGGRAGFRLDRSARSAPQAGVLSAADSLALGVNEHDAVLLGAAVVGRVGAAELFGEFTWDWLVGGAAPPPRQSPLRLTAGARWLVSEHAHVSAHIELGLGARPDLAASARLVAIEPRVTAQFAAGVRFGGASPGPAAPPHAATESGSDELDLAPAPEPLAPEEPTSEQSEEDPPPSTVRVVLLDPDGAPLASATMSFDDTHATTDEDGSFELPLPPEGHVALVVTVPGFETTRHELSRGASLDGELRLALPVEARLPRGQLRGLVLSFDGQPLVARVVISGLEGEVTTDDQGEFEVDVPPGQYEVSLSAPGHTSQDRQLTVRDNGVTVINVDLRRVR